MEDIDMKKFLKVSMGNGLIIIISLFLYLIFLNTIFYLIDFSILLHFEAALILGVQQMLGYPVTLIGTTFYYTPGSVEFLSIELIPECLGVVEMLLFVIMVMVFRGVKNEARIKGIVIFLPIIFIGNIMRLVTLYPLAVMMGVDDMWILHSFVWQYGQLAFLLILFGTWYLTIASPGLLESFSFKERKGRKKTKSKGNNKNAKNRKLKRRRSSSARRLNES